MGQAAPILVSDRANSPPRFFYCSQLFYRLLADGQYAICNDTLGLRDEKPRRAKTVTPWIGVQTPAWQKSTGQPHPRSPLSPPQRPLARAQQPSQPLPGMPTMDLVADHGERPRGVSGIKCAAVSYGIVRRPAVKTPLLSTRPPLPRLLPTPLLDSRAPPRDLHTGE